MTTVIVLKGRDFILMAGDGLSVSHDEIIKDNYKKVVKLNDKLLIGFSGSAKIWEYLWEYLNKDIPLFVRNQSDNYIKVVRDRMFEFFLNDDRMKRMLEDKECNISLLLADNDNICQITSEFECVWWEYPFAAIGSGRAWALGALEISHRCDTRSMYKNKDLLELERVAKEVFEITSKYHLYTNNKINMISLKMKKVS